MSTALRTDLYHVDAAYIAWKHDVVDVAAFDLNTRKAPFDGEFMLLSGVPDALRYVDDFRYTAEDIAFLRSLNRYDEAFLLYLSDVKFSGEILSMSEGSIAFPNEPLMRVTAPFPEALLLESGLLRAIGVSTLISTKAARMKLVAAAAELADFSLRRAHDPEVATRASYIGGFVSTSYVDGARRFGIAASGTIPHALVQAFDGERESFRAVAESFPKFTLLLDTYDFETGLSNAIEVATDARSRWGHELVAVRLDSGDLGAGSRMMRSELDSAGFSDTRVLVSGDIDEFRIQELMEAGCPIDGFGVGGNVGVGMGTSGVTRHPGGVLGAVYKLADYAGDGRMKIAGAKTTVPGKKRVFRMGTFDHDLVQLESEPPPAGGEALLQPVVIHGEVAYEEEPLALIRERALVELGALPERFARLLNADEYPVRFSDGVRALAESTRAEFAAD